MRSKQLSRLVLLLALLAVGYFIWNKYFNKPPLVEKTLVIRTDLPATNINPLLSDGVGGNLYVAQQIFLTLANFDSKTLEQVPVLIKAIPVAQAVSDGPNKGCTAYEFELREEAKWDNGTPITAKDFDFSIKMILNPKMPNPFRSYFTDLKSIELDPANPKKFKVYFAKPYLLACESLCQSPIYPEYHYDPNHLMAKFSAAELADKEKKAALEQNPDLQTIAADFGQAKYKNDPANIVGSGAYRIELMDEQHTILVKKDNWWGDALAKSNTILESIVKRIEYRTVPDETATENMLRNGQLDVVAGSLSAPSFVRWKNDPALASAFDFETVGTSIVSRWYFNCSSPKFNDIRVRQALAHLVNFDYLINTVCQGFAQRTVSMIHPNKSYYASNITPFDFNIEKAKTLLADAGWKDSNGNGIVDKKINGVLTELQVEVMGPLTSQTVKGLLASVKENALQAGVKINELDATMQVMAQKSGGERPDFDSGVASSGLAPSHFDFYDRYFSTNLPPAGQNRCRFQNTKLDSLILQHRVCTDEAKLKTLYVQIQEIIHNDAPEIYLMAPVQRIVISKNWEPMLSNNRPGYVENRFKYRGKTN